jgi:endothelin-converting enzyme/putative endopeptidase
MVFETALAKASMPVTDRRDPEKIYHLQTIETFTQTFPAPAFEMFRTAISSPEIKEINNANPAFLSAMISEIEGTDLDTLKAYMRYHLLTGSANRLPKRFDDENFDFYGRVLTGQPQQSARWKRCSNAVNGALGEALGEVYVSQYFAGDSKAKMLEMVHDIENAMSRDIDQLDWMSAETKVRAKEKLHGIANKIGYPDKWRDYSKLEVKPDDALGNKFRGTAFENDRQLAKIGQPVDHSEWGMTPPTVNAYYDPSMNDINFPAGILQPAFYDPKQDDAVNYGHIGAVIGHELTHGFDDEGRHFDAKGNLRDWWTPADSTHFTKEAQKVVDQFNAYIQVDTFHVNGKLTLGENIADYGGLLTAYDALQRGLKRNGRPGNIEGFTPEQRYFIGYAQSWRSHSRPETMKSRVTVDPHAPERWRVNGPLSNIAAFASAFGCKTGDPMVRQSTLIPHIW